MVGQSITIINPQGNTETPVGDIFAGLSFFVLQRVPLRSDVVRKILTNGGKIVKHEEIADYIIADHARRDSPPGSISWTFIDASFRAKALANTEEHRAGPERGTARVVGSAVPSKGIRTPFTANDDEVLWDWVESAKLVGAPIKGYEIYKQLEERNPRHTYQAWRDHYLKKLMDRPRPGSSVMVAANAPPTPPAAMDTSDIAESVRELPQTDASNKTNLRKEHRTDNEVDGKLSSGYQDGEENDRDTVKHADRVEASPKHFDRADVPSATISNVAGQSKRKREHVSEVVRLQRSDCKTEAEAGVRDGGSHFVGEMPRTAKRSRITDHETTLKNKLKHPITSGLTSYMGENEYGSSGPMIASNSVGETVAVDNDSATSWVASPQEGDVGALDEATSKTGWSLKNALTEANLASQQAQERGNPIRGADLPEDDQMQDQTPYAEFLRSTLPPQFLQHAGIAEPQQLGIQSPRLEPTANMGRDLHETLSPGQPEMHNPSVNPDSLLQKRAFSPEIPESSRSPHSSNDLRSHSAASRKSATLNGDFVTSHVEELNDVDLTIASPEEGWDTAESLAGDMSNTYAASNRPAAEMEFVSPSDNNLTTAHEDIVEISSSMASSTSDDLVEHINRRNSMGWHNAHRSHALETQDIVNAETQYPDLELAEPPGSGEDEDGSLSQSPTPRRQTSGVGQIMQDKPEPEAKETTRDLSAWAQTMMQRGYTAPAIIGALRVCSANSDLAELVLFEIRSGRGIPKDVPGIWSEQDDATLEGGDARGIKRLEEKHGWDECDVRLQYLAEQREADDQ